MNTLNTQKDGEKLQESGQYAQERAAATSPIDLQLEIVIDHADSLLAFLVWAGLAKEIEAAHPSEWEACWRLKEERSVSRDRTDRELRASGYFLAVRAIAETPGVLDRALRHLESHLMAHLIPMVADMLRTAEAGHGQA